MTVLRGRNIVQQVTLGNTGLNVSVAGLGCGGNSRLGLSGGASTAESVALVREAIELGVNFIDTAENYGTEHIVGQSLNGLDRSNLVLSTKTQIRKQGERVPPAQVTASIERSLLALNTDYIDIFHLHGVLPEDYEYAVNDIAPLLTDARRAGKIRHIGITETSPRDPHQTMLDRATQEAPWEVVMLAFNMMNQGARRTLLPRTIERGIGTLIMFAVRNVFSQTDALRKTLQELAEKGAVPTELASEKEPLQALVELSGADSVTDAAYRFARHQPGANVVLFGTGSRAHLAANINSINAAPLNPVAIEKMHALFADLVGVGLEFPDRFKTTP